MHWAGPMRLTVTACAAARTGDTMGVTSAKIANEVHGNLGALNNK